MKEIVNAERAAQLVLVASVLGPKRKPTGPFDFGDERTNGLCVKRVGKSFHDLDSKNDYGFYLGRPEGGREVVAIKDLTGNIPGAELFEDIHELKQEWQLD